jgi:hypothetical protein
MVCKQNSWRWFSRSPLSIQNLGASATCAGVTDADKFSIVDLEDEYIIKPKGLSRSRPGLHPTEASVAYELNGIK